MNFKIFSLFLAFQSAHVAYGIGTNPVRHQPTPGAGTVSTQPVRNTPPIGAGTVSTQPVGGARPLPGSVPRPSGNRYILMMELSPEAEAKLVKHAADRNMLSAIMKQETDLLAKDIEKWLVAQGLSGKIKIVDKLHNLGSILISATDDVDRKQLSTLENAFKKRIGLLTKETSVGLGLPARPNMRVGGAIGAAILAGSLATEAKAASDKQQARAHSEVRSSVETESTDEFVH